MKRKQWTEESMLSAMNIAQSLRKYNEEVHVQGETLTAHQTFCVKVVKTFLLAGVPLSKSGHFHELLEETGYRLTDRRH